VHHSKNGLLMSEMGQQRRSPVHAHEVRFTSVIRHWSRTSVCRIRAKGGHCAPFGCVGNYCSL